MIREAVANDAELLENLYKKLAPSSKNINVVPERLEEIRHDENNYLFVYADGEKLLGTIFITFCMDAMYQYRPYAIIENFIVVDGSRGKGIGSSLLKHIEDICKSKACSKMMLLSSISRVEAHQFFENRGFSGKLSKGFKKYIKIT